MIEAQPNPDGATPQWPKPAWFRLQIFWAGLILIFWIVGLARLQMDINYTAGELLDHLLSWAHGNALYPKLSSTPYRVLNYPPLYLLFAKTLHEIGLSPLWSGRAVNLIGFAAMLWVVYRWLRSEGCDKVLSLFTLSLISTSFPVLYGVGQFHLQIPAVAASLGALYLLRSPDSLGKIFAGTLLLAMACLIKQTQVLTALIAFLWLWKYHRKSAFLFLLLLLIWGTLSWILMWQIFGAEVWRHLVQYTVGEFSLGQLGRQFLTHFLPWAVFFGFALTFGLKSQACRRGLPWWYLTGSSLALLTSARLGSSAFYFIEWSLALLLVLGPGLVGATFFLKRLPRWLFVLQILLANLAVAGLLAYNLYQGFQKVGVAQEICTSISEPQVLIGSDDPGLVRYCGHRPALHPFIMTSLSEQGLWDSAPFLNDIQQGKLEAIVLSFDPREEANRVQRERWAPQWSESIMQHYRITKEVGGFTLWEPKEP